MRHRDALKSALDAAFTARPRAEIIATLTQAGVPCGAVRDVAETLADPQLTAREMIATLPHAVAGSVQVLGTPLKLSDTPASLRSAPPALGQHTDRILQNDCGLSEREIDELKSRGVV